METVRGKQAVKETSRVPDFTLFPAFQWKRKCKIATPWKRDVTLGVLQKDKKKKNNCGREARTPEENRIAEHSWVSQLVKWVRYRLNASRIRDREVNQDKKTNSLFFPFLVSLDCRLYLHPLPPTYDASVTGSTCEQEYYRWFQRKTRAIECQRLIQDNT